MGSGHSLSCFRVVNLVTMILLDQSRFPTDVIFNHWLLNENRRCVRNVEYLFYAQYFNELKQILGDVGSALRLCKPGQKTAASIKKSIQDVIRDSDAYNFCNQFGTPIPTGNVSCVISLLWFGNKKHPYINKKHTFSTADIVWTESIQIITRH